MWRQEGQRGRETGCLCLASRSYFYVCKQSKYTSPKYWCQKSGSMQVLGAFKQQSAESHPFCLNGGHAIKWDMLRIWFVADTHISVWLCFLVWARNLVNSQTSKGREKADSTYHPHSVGSGHAMKWDMLRIWSVPAKDISVWLCFLV